jgi:hypothetical protein
MKLTPKDHAVIKAFYSKDQAESTKLMTNGQVLDGLWMGGSSIAEWDGGKIKFNDLGSKAAQTVQNAVKRYVPKNSLKQAGTQRLASDVLRDLEIRVARLERSKQANDADTTFLEFLIEDGNKYLRKIKITSSRLTSWGGVEGTIPSKDLDMTVGDSQDGSEGIIVTFHTKGNDDYIDQMELDAHALSPGDFERKVMAKANTL